MSWQPYTASQAMKYCLKVPGNLQFLLTKCWLRCEVWITFGSLWQLWGIEVPWCSSVIYNHGLFWILVKYDSWPNPCFLWERPCAQWSLEDWKPGVFFWDVRVALRWPVMPVISWLHKWFPTPTNRFLKRRCWIYIALWIYSGRPI